MNIVKKLIRYNYTSKPNRKFEYINIHDTGNRSKGAGALMHYNYFNSGNKNASADFFVDDKNVLQFIDIDNAYSWAVGDGAGKNGITNDNSISIEICINPDSDYDVTIANTIELVVGLMKKYNIPIDRVKRHFDASGKNCPQTMNNNGDWSKWNEFKNRVNILFNQSNVPVVPQQPSADDILFKENLDWLVSYGKLSSPDYWIANCVPNGKVDGMYARKVLNRFADLIKSIPTV